MKQPAAIFDRDGTLFRVNRDFLIVGTPSWRSFNAAIPFDDPVKRVVALTHALRPDVKVLVTSGRNEMFRYAVDSSLVKHGVNFDRLFMREYTDQRPDDVVKAEIYWQEIEPYYDVRLVVDDRGEVCDMWESIGLPLIRVTQPEDNPPFTYLRGQE